MGTNDVTYYAHWIIRVNQCFSLRQAIEEVEANKIQTVIYLEKCETDHIIIKENQNILLKLQNNTLNNTENNTNAIKNYGIIEIENGTVQSSNNYAAIDNEATGIMKIRGATILGFGSQGICNNGGDLYIDENVQITANKSYAIENRYRNNRGANTYIRNGIIMATNSPAIKNPDDCTLTIGTKDDKVNLSSPIICGNDNAITGTGEIHFYDGIIKGTSKKNLSNSLMVQDKENGFILEDSVEIIDNKNYKTLYLVDWSNIYFAEVNGIPYKTLQEAVSSVTGSEQTTVKLLKNTSEKIVVNSGQNIIFDLQNYTISNNGNNQVIDNSGTITIQNGTLSSTDNTGVINNNSGAILIMTGGQVLATGTRQAIWNNGGTVKISGTAYLSAKAQVQGTNKRGTVHNLDSGTLEITGGTIVALGNDGIAVSNSGKMTIGTLGEGVSTEFPKIQSNGFGVYSTGSFNFYDGIVKSLLDPFNDESISIKETGYEFIHTTEKISNYTYNVVYLEKHR